MVSSDRAVQQAAARAGARALSGQEFQRDMEAGAGDDPGAEKPEGISNKEELAYWQKLFRRRDRGS